MEKFRQFTDERKGVNAFVPSWSNPKADSLWIVKRLLLLALFPFRVAFSVVFLALIWLLSSAGVTVLLLPILCRIQLFVLGVCCGVEDADLRRLRMQDSKKASASSSKQVIICNRQGPLDVLICGALHGSNHFVFTSPSG